MSPAAGYRVNSQRAPAVADPAEADPAVADPAVADPPGWCPHPAHPPSSPPAREHRDQTSAAAT